MIFSSLEIFMISYYNLRKFVCLFVRQLLPGPWANCHQTWYICRGWPQKCHWGLFFWKVKVTGVKGHISISPRPLARFHPNLVYVSGLVQELTSRGQRSRSLGSRSYSKIFDISKAPGPILPKLGMCIRLGPSKYLPGSKVKVTRVKVILGQFHENVNLIANFQALFIFRFFTVNSNV